MLVAVIQARTEIDHAAAALDAARDALGDLKLGLSSSVIEAIEAALTKVKIARVRAASLAHEIPDTGPVRG